MRTILAWTILGICGALGAAACSDDSDDDLAPCDAEGAAGGEGNEGEVEATCAGLVAKMTGCELLTGARLSGCSDEHPVLPCTAECLRKANCGQLQAAYCRDSFNSFAGCLNECNMGLPLPEFTCNDGTRISVRWKCDGAADCPDGEDEECPEGSFTCNDGLIIPAAWRCDLADDCDGGEDELDCPGNPRVTCDDGTSIDLARDCDGTPDCAGGEDEIDCAILTCE